MITQIIWFFTWPLLIFVANFLIQIAVAKYESMSL
jgi:hypothetical protein